MVARGSLRRRASDERVGGFVLDVEEDDAGALAGEVGDEGFADAGGSAGDEDGAVAEAGVGGVRWHWALIVADVSSELIVRVELG